MDNTNYSVEIIETVGSMSSPVFKKMAERGDITSVKINEVIGSVVNVTGFAWCKITTKDKEFNMGYYMTDLGIVSTGSEIFKESVADYFKDGISKFNIVQVRTKNGQTYKVSPVLEIKEDVE